VPQQGQPPDARGFPAGAAVTAAVLAADPHPALRRLREQEPVSWLPALGGWLVTRHDLALRVLRDSATFTVDDPRFTTARVVGPSMLSLDGPRHARHRDPFSRALRAAAERGTLAALVSGRAGQLIAALRPAGRAELRRALAGPLAAAVMADLLALPVTSPAELLTWYDAIVGAVSALARAGGEPPGGPDRADGCDARSGAAEFAALRLRLHAAAGSPGLLADATAGGTLSADELVSNAAVLLFGGIETTEGMICNAIWHLLTHPDQLALVRADSRLLDAAVEESLRLEPAAAMVDRFATGDVTLAGAGIRGGDQVSVSLAAASRDPAAFTNPDQFDVRRRGSRLSLAFAHGPHFCPGAQLARLEAVTAIRLLLDGMAGLRLDQSRPSAPRGLVFRKPPELHVRWDGPPPG
jgi:cytochrome P450